MKHWICILFVIGVIETLRAEEMETVQSNQYFTFKSFEVLKSSSALEQNRDKLVIIHVWASWCLPCIEELPDLLELAQTLQKELAVIIVALESRKEDQEYFLNRIFMEYREPSSNVMFVEEGSEIDALLDVPGVPVSYLFDRNRKFILTALGRQYWSGTRSIFVPNWWPFSETWEEFLVECYFDYENCSNGQRTGKRFEGSFPFQPSIF